MKNGKKMYWIICTGDKFLLLTWQLEHIGWKDHRKAGVSGLVFARPGLKQAEVLCTAPVCAHQVDPGPNSCWRSVHQIATTLVSPLFKADVLPTGVEPGCLDGIENVDIPPAKQDSCPDHSTGIQARKLPFGCAERFQISSISREIWQEFLVLDFVSDAITFGPFYATFGWC